MINFLNLLNCVTSMLLSLTCCAKEDENSMYFGKYPKKVTDETLISKLNTTAGTLLTLSNTNKWTNYGYYINGAVSSYMYYIDLVQDNDVSFDYRGVYFTQYRLYWTTESDSNFDSYTDEQ